MNLTPDAQVQVLYTAPSVTDANGTCWQALSDCHFAGSTGWACGGQLLRTFDQGREWKSLCPPAVGLHHIFAINTWTAYLLGYTQPDFALWYTEDAGETWKQTLVDENLGFHPVFFNCQGMIGIATPDRCRQNRVKLLTATIGSSLWTQTECEIPGEPECILMDESGIGLMIVSVCNASAVSEQERISQLAKGDEEISVPLALPERSLIFKTENGGTDWSELSSIDGWLSNILTTETTMFAYGPAGIFRSSNRGNSWVQIEFDLPKGAGINAIACGRGILAAVGDYGYVGISADDGKSWAGRLVGPESDNHLAVTILESEFVIVGSRYIKKVRL